MSTQLEDPAISAEPAATPSAATSSGVKRIWERLRQRPDLLWAVALGLVSYVTLRITSPAVGFTRDEGYYFKAGEQYFGWYRELWRNLWAGKLLETFSDATILRFFEYNHEHPALIKTLMGFTWWWTHEVLGVSSHAEGFRAIGPLFAGLCVALTFALARRARLARPYAVFAGLSWLLMPHNYFYSHLACFDVPVTAMTVAVVYTYLAGRRTLRGALIAGLVFGLACATKHNALFLGILFVGHWALTRWSAFRFQRGAGGGLRLPPLPLAWPLMVLFAVAIMYLHWPYLWHHPLERFGSYLSFHANHEHYPVSFGDGLLLVPPFPLHFPFTMTAYTVPLGMLVLGVVGMGLALRGIARDPHFRGDGVSSWPHSLDEDPPSSTHLMWGIMALFPVVLIALPSVPIFGGVKHWMPAMPFLALFAALALERAVAALRSWQPRRLAVFSGARLPAALALLVLLPAAVDTVRTHPYGMSYYNALAGGVRGGAEHNLQRTFWGHSSRQLIVDALNRAPDNSRVFFNRTNYDSVRMYQRDGLLKRSVRYASKVEQSDFALIYYQGGYYEELYKVWQEYGSHQPLESVYLQGVPLVGLYARPGKSLAAAQPGVAEN